METFEGMEERRKRKRGSIGSIPALACRGGTRMKSGKKRKEDGGSWWKSLSTKGRKKRCHNMNPSLPHFRLSSLRKERERRKKIYWPGRRRRLLRQKFNPRSGKGGGNKKSILNKGVQGGLCKEKIHTT